MKLEILTPEKILFSGNVDSVTLPGVTSNFTVLRNHAPIIAALTKGTIKFSENRVPAGKIEIESGFCEVFKNEVYICVEKMANEHNEKNQ
jgi:F-type H+-transporting ATPase subunit epsilon